MKIDLKKLNQDLMKRTFRTQNGIDLTIFHRFMSRKCVSCDAKRSQILKLNGFQWLCQLSVVPDGNDHD